jgi:predicted ATPase
MRLSTVFIRFYKSFNYDYLRKLHPKAEAKLWEQVEKMWYPYVQVPIDSKVTTVVGANESGKSHLLDAIEKAISGEGIRRSDFCRYSKFFNVRNGDLRYPDFGSEWIELSEADKKVLRKLCGIPEERDFDRFLLFRSKQETITVYLPNGESYDSHTVQGINAPKVVDLLPRSFRIDSDVALPERVNIRRLINRDLDNAGFASFEPDQRDRIVALIGKLSEDSQHIETSLKSTLQQIPETVQKNLRDFMMLITTPSLHEKQQELDIRRKEYDLAYKLICKVANVDPGALSDLAEALQKGNGGYASGLIDMINEHLAESLNFPSWWVQDRDFQLKLDLRDYDLVFTIRDRTGTEYSFKERSRGLRYFLSYYIQYRAHEPSGKPEILLMDEPDSYLSSQAQQDLLKIFEAFATPDGQRDSVQVVYVTHSPFLIDKNHSERIRVLEKGVEDEGTRVVRDAAKNHYEPLRSAFGAFVGEMAFIGNCNLMVEGLADQILLAGTATYLRSKGVSNLETLDLNHITIVPASGASHIPYLTYLARGRDIEQPAVIVLLDSDQGGNEAKKALKRGGARGKQVLRENLILQIGEMNEERSLSIADGINLTEIEDLIPLPICAAAAHLFYAVTVCGATKEFLEAIPELLSKQIKQSKSIFPALETIFLEASEDGMHIEKVGFARSVVDVINKNRGLSSPLSVESVKQFENNFKVLFKRLNKLRRDAEREKHDENFAEKIDRRKKAFLQDHPTWARREEALLLLEDLEAMLSDDQESDAIRGEIMSLNRRHNLENEPLTHIDGEQYEKFKEGLERVKYAGRLESQEF